MRAAHPCDLVSNGIDGWECVHKGSCMQVETLEKLAQLGLADNCARVVESGKVSEEMMSYVLLQPVGRHLGLNEDAKTIIQVSLRTLLAL